MGYVITLLVCVVMIIYFVMLQGGLSCLSFRSIPVFTERKLCSAQDVLKVFWSGKSHSH
jgi:hypothetical protein